eukprot:UN30041
MSYEVHGNRGLFEEPRKTIPLDGTILRTPDSRNRTHKQDQCTKDNHSGSESAIRSRFIYEKVHHEKPSPKDVEREILLVGDSKQENESSSKNERNQIQKLAAENERLTKSLKELSDKYAMASLYVNLTYDSGMESFENQVRMQLERKARIMEETL